MRSRKARLCNTNAAAGFFLSISLINPNPHELCDWKIRLWPLLYASFMASSSGAAKYHIRPKGKRLHMLPFWFSTREKNFAVCFSIIVSNSEPEPRLDGIGDAETTWIWWLCANPKQNPQWVMNDIQHESRLNLIILYHCGEDPCNWSI